MSDVQNIDSNLYVYQAIITILTSTKQTYPFVTMYVTTVANAVPVKVESEYRNDGTGR